MTRKFATLAVLAIAAISIQATSASAVSLSVKRNCAADYFSYCSQHGIGGKAVRQCMRTNGYRLSKRCVNALVAAGEVSKSTVNRRSAKLR